MKAIKHFIEQYGISAKSALFTYAFRGNEVSEIQDKFDTVFAITPTDWDFNFLKQLEIRYPNFKTYKFSPSDKHEMVNMTVTDGGNDMGKMQSILEWNKFKEFYSGLRAGRKDRVACNKIDDHFISTMGKIPDIDLIYINQNGSELQAIKGAVKTIMKSKYVIVSYNSKNLWRGQGELYEIDQFMGATHRMIDEFQMDRCIGQILFVRNDIKIANADSSRVNRIVNASLNLENRPVNVNEFPPPGQLPVTPQKSEFKQVDVKPEPQIPEAKLQHIPTENPIPLNLIINDNSDNIVKCPDEFLRKSNVIYPFDNNLMFEQYFAQHFANEKLQFNRKYIPVQWTSYYHNNNYGKNEAGMNALQQYLNSLDKKQKYFTVLQYDDGILQDISKLDIKVYSSGKKQGFPIPLVCQPHEYITTDRRTLASFVGKLETHPIRQKMFETLSTDEDFMIFNSSNDNIMFKRMMQQSYFALCPRGYGATSFRICEALQAGAIPVYISDEFIIPFAEQETTKKKGRKSKKQAEEIIEEKTLPNCDYMILITEDKIKELPEILRNMSINDVIKYRVAGKKAYQNMFSYVGLYDSIIEDLKKQQ